MSDLILNYILCLATVMNGCFSCSICCCSASWLWFSHPDESDLCLPCALSPEAAVAQRDASNRYHGNRDVQIS